MGFVGSVASLLALLAFAAVNAALIRLRFTQPERPRPFRAPLRVGRVPVLTVLALLVVLVLLVQFKRAAYGLAAAAIAVAVAVRSLPRLAGSASTRTSDGR